MELLYINDLTLGIECEITDAEVCLRYELNNGFIGSACLANANIWNELHQTVLCP